MQSDADGCSREQSRDAALPVALCVHGEIRREGAELSPEVLNPSDAPAPVEADDTLKPREPSNEWRKLCLRRPRDAGGRKGRSQGVEEGYSADHIAQMREAHQEDSLG
jgi:hypothetical protein